MNKSHLNIAILGCGKIAKRHAEHINNKANLIAVCDIVKESADELAEKFNSTPFYYIEKLINSDKRIDLVSVCTPNGLHAEHSIKLLNNGYHVLCEKPMALSTYDAGEMIKASERNNKRLFIVKQNRFNPPVKKVKELIDDGRLGKIFNIQLNCFWNRNQNYYKNSDWKGTKELDGGILFTQFSHFIDLLYWMIGDIYETKAFTNNFLHQNITEFEDTGAVIIRFYNGAIGTINFTTNATTKNMEGSLTIFGSRGTVKIGGQYLNELEYQDIIDEKIIELEKGNKPNNYGEYVGSMSNHDIVYDNVIDVLDNNGSISTNHYEGLKTVEIIEKIYKAI